MHIQQLCEEYQQESPEKVLYVAAENLPHYKVTFVDGAAMTGCIISSPLYSNKPYFREPQIIFALIIPATNNPKQNLYAIQLKSRSAYDGDKYVHHSSISAGGPVLFAASIRTDQFGIIKYIANDSGHYKPNLESFIAGIKHLLSIDADLSNAKFLLYDKVDDRLKQYEDSTVFLRLYITEGFDSVNYAAKVDSIEDAMQDLNSKPIVNNKVYFIENKCDLYEYDHLTRKFISFTEKYQVIEKTPNAKIQKRGRELQYQSSLQNKQQTAELERLDRINKFSPELKADIDRRPKEETPERECSTPPPSNPKRARMG